MMTSSVVMATLERVDWPGTFESAKAFPPNMTCTGLQRRSARGESSGGIRVSHLPQRIKLPAAPLALGPSRSELGVADPEP